MKFYSGLITLLVLIFLPILVFGKVSSTEVIYGVVPSFFGKEPLQSVRSHLPRLADLGVDTLWLSPLQESEDIGAISYSITNHFQLRDDFGTEEDLRSLVTEAHELGMKVILDFVPNHSSMQHPYYLHGQKLGGHSEFFDFYDRNEDGEHEFYFDWDYLPNFNFKNSRVIDYMKSAFFHWIEKFNVDGYRIDVAWGVHERSPTFWNETISELRSINPDLVMLAEAPGRDPAFPAVGFDLAYDWSDELGVWAWQKVFGRQAGLAGRLHEELTKSEKNQQTILRFLNNNDTGKRFITKYGLQKFKTASVLQYTLPGAILLYSGDEVGAEYEPYEDPPPIDWDDDPNGLQEFFKHLIQVRKNLPGLQSSVWTPITTDPKGAIYACSRGEGESEVLVLLNFGKKGKIEIPGEELEFYDVLSGSKKIAMATGLGKATVELKSHEALVLIPFQRLNNLIKAR